MIQKIFQTLTLAIFFLLPLALHAADPVPESLPFPPGTIEERKKIKVLYFESNLYLEWKENLLTLKSLSNPVGTVVNLLESPEKKSARELLDDQVQEQDLGGKSSKKPPLAYKNPKVRVIPIPEKPDPFKGSSVKPKQTTEQKTAEGSLQTLTYEDGSKKEIEIKGSLKIERAYHRTGKLLSENIEGEDKGFKIRKTQWDDGTHLSEYTSAQGTLSIVEENQKRDQIFSFLNSKREVVTVIHCQQESCEKE